MYLLYFKMVLRRTEDINTSYARKLNNNNFNLYFIF